jgi:predicted hydrocarbon binding protein
MQDDFAQLKKENEELRDLNWRLEWRLNHARSQYRAFLQAVIPLMDSEQLKLIFQELGRNCARSLGWATKYKGDPEGFFAHMKAHSEETIAFSEDRKTITIVTQHRPCDCPIMKDQCVDGQYCECSIGWQQETYETILDKKVSVNIKEACFRGSDRCVFEVIIEE